MSGDALPKGWQMISVGEICILGRGRVISQIDIDNNPGPYPVYSSQTVNHGAFGFLNTFDFDGEYATWTTDGANAGTVFYRNGKFNCTNVCGTLKAKNTSVDMMFVSYALGFVAKKHVFIASGNPKLMNNVVAKIEIPIPPLDEQRRIAARLNEQMAAVQQARQATESQLQAARALPSTYLREVFDSRGAQKWQRCRLGNICEITARQIDPKIPEYGALPHVNGENIESGTCHLLYLNSASDEGMTSQKYLFDPGDVLYSKLRPYLRKVILADFKGVCSADMYPIKANFQELTPEFLMWVMVSDEFTKYADEESRRSRMPKLNREQLFAWETPLPPLAEQKHIAAFLKEKTGQTKQLINSLESQLATINQLPAALLRQAFTGGLS